MSKVFWRILPERTGASNVETFEVAQNIAEHCGRLKDYHRLKLDRHLPPAHARNAACQAFMEVEEIGGKKVQQSPDDTLVMLDCDHLMQEDIVPKLAAHTVGVVGALATSRGDVPFICAFGYGKDGSVYNLSEWEDGELAECMVVGSGAIAIKRWVFYRLQHCQPSWFRYQYGGYRFESTEEMYFGYECAKAGISHYVDTSIWIPHLTSAYTTPDEWRAYYRDHPEVKSKLEVPAEVKELTPAKREPNENGRQQEGGVKTWEHIAANVRQL